jgi:hypothetical protein
LKNKFLGQKNICNDFPVTAVIEIDAKQAMCQSFFFLKKKSGQHFIRSKCSFYKNKGLVARACPG